MLEASGLLQVRPPITPAFSGDRTVRAIPFQVLSWFPRIVVYPAFVDKARCETIIKVATQRMYPSGLAYRPGEQVEGEQQTRTSKGTFLAAGSDGEGVLEWVEERIATITMLPRENGEPFNVLQYQHMQHYDSHMDSFDPKVGGAWAAAAAGSRGVGLRMLPPTCLPACCEHRPRLQPEHIKRTCLAAAARQFWQGYVF